MSPEMQELIIFFVSFENLEVKLFDSIHGVFFDNLSVVKLMSSAEI